jgi:hypothetical protein
MTDFRLWRKSSYSGAAHQDCLEVSESRDAVRIRDTQHRSHGHLSFPWPEWHALISEVKAGRL